MKDGDLVFTGGELQMIEGAEELGQEIEIELQTNRGEFFLAPDDGLPFEAVLQKKPDPEAIRAAIADTLNRNDRVVSLDDVQAFFNAKNRSLDIKIRATGQEDVTISAEVNRNVR